MFFTLEDYKKIYEWISRNSIKDTEFNEALTPLDETDTITLVLNGVNVRVSLKDLIDQLFLMGVSDFLNITDKFGEKNITLDLAIELIPYKSRKLGQVITFLDNNNKWKIYLFIGELTQWDLLNLWEDILDIEAHTINSILPDEEDLTKSLPDANGNSYLSLKDRAYNPEDFSGFGRVILRKNIVEVEDPVYGKVKKNILYQDMINKENTIYVIQYDFTLGEDITIPANCILEFDGGSINAGSGANTDTLTGNYYIVAQSTKIFNNIDLSTYKYPVKFAWFKLPGSAISQSDINKLPRVDIDFENNTYTLASEIVFHSFDYFGLYNLKLNSDYSIRKYLPSLTSGTCYYDTSSEIPNTIILDKTLPSDYVGKLIKIITADAVDWDDRPDAQGIPTLRKGVFSIISKIDGNKVTIEHSIYAFTANRTYNSITIDSTYKIFNPDSFVIKNCKFNIGFGESVALFGYNFRVEDSFFKSVGGTSGLILTSGVNGIYENCDINDSLYDDTATSYGLQIEGGTAIKIKNCRFKNNRRAVDFSGSSQTRYCLVENCEVTQGSNVSYNGSALGGHSTSYKNIIRGCRIFGIYLVGIQFRGTEEIAENNEFNCYCNGGVFAAGVNSIFRGNRVVSNNTDTYDLVFNTIPNNKVTIINNIAKLNRSVVSENPSQNPSTYIIKNNIFSNCILFNNPIQEDNKIVADGNIFKYNDFSFYRNNIIPNGSVINLLNQFYNGVEIPIKLSGWNENLSAEDEAKITYSVAIMKFSMDSVQNYNSGVYGGRIKIYLGFTLSGTILTPTRIVLNGSSLLFRSGNRALNDNLANGIIRKPDGTQDLIIASNNLYIGLGTYNGYLTAGTYYIEADL